MRAQLPLRVHAPRGAARRRRHLRRAARRLGDEPRLRRDARLVLHLSGARDEFYTPERVADYAARLRTRAADVETHAYDAGHEFVPAMRADVRAWLAARV